MRVLFVATSHEQMGNTDKKTGVWLEEIAVPYYILKNAGTDITIASPLGGEVPLDPRSQSIIAATQSSRRFLKDGEAMNLLSHAAILEDISAADFDAVILPGGHGLLWDLANHAGLKQLLEAFNRQGKTIAAISHGVVGLLSLQNAAGDFLVKNKKLTCFSNSEEKLSGFKDVVPFSLENKLVSQGAQYSKGEDYSSFVVIDGNLITGQNPASSLAVAKKMLISLEKIQPVANAPHGLN